MSETPDHPVQPGRNPSQSNPPSPTIWWVYMLRCDRQALYTGISTDVARRLQQHLRGRGARSLRRYSSLELVYNTAVGERGLALQVEYRIKQLNPAAKQKLVGAQPDRAALLSLLGLATVEPCPG